MTEAVETREDIMKLLVDIRDQLRALGIRRLGLFGSFVRGEQRATSDIDILVEFQPGQKTFDHFMQACCLLEDSLHRRVELVTPESLSPHIGPRIVEEVKYVLVAA
jgi:uncharacterized protein